MNENKDLIKFSFSPLHQHMMNTVIVPQRDGSLSSLSSVFGAGRNTRAPQPVSALLRQACRDQTLTPAGLVWLQHRINLLGRARTEINSRIV